MMNDSIVREHIKTIDEIQLMIKTNYVHFIVLNEI